MKGKIALLIFSLALLSPSFTNAQVFAEMDPTYKDGSYDDADDTASDDSADQLEDNVLSDMQNEVDENPDERIVDSLPVNNGALAEMEVNERKFALIDSADAISDRISDETSEKNISVSNLSFKRQGGMKSFNFEQIKTANLNTKLTVKDVEVNADETKFVATLKPAVGDYIIEVSGSYSASIKVPLLTRNINKGAQITQDDIELKNYPKTEILKGDISEVSSIIGKTTTKALSKGKMVSEEDIRSPILVPKNSTVSAIYRTDTIEVKALAVALDDGGEGDVIRLKNFDSGRTFKAVVQADGNVFIGSNPKDLNLSTANSPTQASKIN
jgi:flagella basal body P-ring formation protein FlgA